MITPIQDIANSMGKPLQKTHVLSSGKHNYGTSAFFGKSNMLTTRKMETKMLHNEKPTICDGQINYKWPLWRDFFGLIWALNCLHSPVRDWLAFSMMRSWKLDFGKHPAHPDLRYVNHRALPTCLPSCSIHKGFVGLTRLTTKARMFSKASRWKTRGWTITNSRPKMLSWFFIRRQQSP